MADPVCLIDVAPTVLGLLGVPAFDADGIDLRPALAGRRLPQREIYAESFAPLVEFGWSPLRALRSGRWKAVAAPRPELYDLDDDPAETRDMSGGAQAAAAGSELSTLLARIDRYSAPDLPKAGDRARGVGADARARLGALGYVQGGRSPANRRVDPKDRRELAARIATVASGEVRGDALLAALGAIVADDGGNGQMQLRLGDALAERRQYRDAAPHFAAAIAAGVPSADPYIGLALCKARLGDAPGALATLRRSEAVEPGNPVVDANIGLLEAGLGHTDAAVAALERALAVDPGFDEARFNLAIVCARAGRRARALAAAEDLLRRLSPSSPQRGEVERLVQTLASPEAGRLP